MYYLIKRISYNIDKNLLKIKRHNIGRQLLKILLKKHYNIDYNNIEIITNNYGKPYIKNMNIYFSISYSYKYVICIISNKEIGIDIEKIRKTNINTKKIFGTKLEQDYIDNYEKLFKIFTLKEAYFKMLGTDLRKIKDIEFKMNNNIICSDDSVNISQIKYNNYIISICKKK